MSETPTSVIKTSPDFALHRQVTAADGAPAITDKALGMSCEGVDKAVVQVVPETGDNPSVEVQFWSDKAGAFVQAHTPLAFAGVGASTPYSFAVDVNGQFTLVKVTGGVATGASIYMAAVHRRVV